jgi:DNA adenine methylase
MKAVSRPALLYHGGKWKLAPWVITHMPAHRFYVEPFGGGASVLLRKPRSYGEVYNDLDSEVVNVFRILRDPERALQLTRLLEMTPFARDEFNQAYEPAADELEQARRTIIKSFMGFGADAVHRRAASIVGMRSKPSSWKATTGMRSSVKRSGTTPATDWSRYPSLIGDFTARLQGVVIENRDAV